MLSQRSGRRRAAALAGGLEEQDAGGDADVQALDRRAQRDAQTRSSARAEHRRRASPAPSLPTTSATGPRRSASS